MGDRWPSFNYKTPDVFYQFCNTSHCINLPCFASFGLYINRENFINSIITENITLVIHFLIFVLFLIPVSLVMKTIVAALLVMGCYSLANCKVGLDDPFEIKWVWVNTTTVASAKTTYNFEPAGYEGPGVTSYLCRANVVDQSGTKNWLPGKQIGDRCFVQRDDPQTEFQVPDMSLGSTSWIPLPHFDPRTIPSKAVIGGRH